MTREGQKAARAKKCTSCETEWRIMARWFSLSFIGPERVEKHTEERGGGGTLPAFDGARCVDFIRESVIRHVPNELDW